MTDELTFLRQMHDLLVLSRDKLDLLIPQISINQPLMEVSGILGAGLNQICERMLEMSLAETRTINDPQGVLGWLEAHHPALYGLLLMTDEFMSGVIFDDSTTHTISWHLAQMAKGKGFSGLIGRLACDALNGLSPDHCATVMREEGA